MYRITGYTIIVKGNYISILYLVNVTIVVSGVVRRIANLHWFVHAHIELEMTYAAPEIAPLRQLG